MNVMRKFLITLVIFIFCLSWKTKPIFAASCSLVGGGGGANVILNKAGVNEDVVVALKIPSSIMAKMSPANPKRKNVENHCTADIIQSVYICGFCDETDNGGNATISIPSDYFPGDGSYVYAVGKKALGTCGLQPQGAYIYCQNAGITVSQNQIKQDITLLKPESCFTSCSEYTMGTCTGGAAGIKTALGCFPTNPPEIIKWLLGVGAVVGGALSFLQMLWGAFQTIMSSGDPEKLKAGQETIISAIEGILVIIFAVFILRLIGFTILKIPGFG
jgi:hypothetical protein